MDPVDVEKLIESARTDAEAVMSGKEVEPKEKPEEVSEPVQDLLAKNTELSQLWDGSAQNPTMGMEEQEKLAAYTRQRNLGIAKVVAALDAFIEE